VKITFALPAHALAPLGGYKIVYEYARRLHGRGHQVSVVHAANCRPKTTWREYAKVLAWLKGALIDHNGPPWFQLPPGVRALYSPTLHSRFLPKGDAIFATAWQTATHVASADQSKGRKYYLVQHYENWDGDERAVQATWKLPLHKVVIAKWLRETAELLGEAESTTYIPNGLDLGHFQITRDLANRDQKRVGMLYHRQTWKGSSDGLQVLKRLKERYPNLEAILFGVPRRPAGLPSWIDYETQPSPKRLRDIYNACSIFLQPSHTEGWGLTATESMACGCALVTTDNGGSRDYALDDETALVASSGDVEGLAARISWLLDDEERRIRLAEAGHEYVQRFDWPTAVNSLESLISSTVP
jgi:glycosyltransferase involved in cell wall biosynthesis